MSVLCAAAECGVLIKIKSTVAIIKVSWHTSGDQTSIQHCMGLLRLDGHFGLHNKNPTYLQGSKYTKEGKEKEKEIKGE